MRGHAPKDSRSERSSSPGHSTPSRPDVLRFRTSGVAPQDRAGRPKNTSTERICSPRIRNPRSASCSGRPPPALIAGFIPPRRRIRPGDSNARRTAAGSARHGGLQHRRRRLAHGEKSPAMAAGMPSGMSDVGVTPALPGGASCWRRDPRRAASVSMRLMRRVCLRMPGT